MIVDIAQSEYVDEGSVSIQKAAANPSGESYILDFSYYLKQGLIQDTIGFNIDLNNFYAELKELNNALEDIAQEQVLVEEAITKVRSNISVYEALLEEARTKQTNDLQDFIKETQTDYETYIKNHEDDLDIPENILKKIGELYALATVINNYSGILSNLKQEYQELKIKNNGISTYTFSVTTTPPQSSEESITTSVIFDEYIEGCLI